MPDTKISAMPINGFVGNHDLLPIVQAGSNFKAQRKALLEAIAGEFIQLSGNAGSSFSIDPFGGVTVTVGAGQTLSMTANGAGILIDAVGLIDLTPAPGHALVLAYDPATPGDWAGSPTTVWEALDRIAAVVSAGGASPIP